MTFKIFNLVPASGPLLISYQLPAYLKINLKNYNSLGKISFINTLCGSKFSIAVMLAQDPTPKQLNDLKFTIRI
jgi:hypothetical protein